MSDQAIPMRDILSSNAVIARLDASTKKDVLQTLAGHAATLTGQDVHEIFHVLWEREKLGTTGVGNSIAIPHGRLEKLDKVRGLFARLVRPVPFDSVDDKPVDLVFMLLAPGSAGADHLHALATVSRILRDTKLCEQLRRAKDEDSIYQLLTNTQTAEAA